MPLSSHQVNGLLGSQQLMFSQYAQYSGGVSYGSMVNPDSAPIGPYAMVEDMAWNAGAHAMAAGTSAVPTAMRTAGFVGSFLPGAAGTAMSMLDPWSAAMTGALRGSGITSGITSSMGMGASLGKMGGNFANIASGGFGSMARAGLGGIAGGMALALPAYALTEGLTYAGQTMTSGAQFNNAVAQSLARNFRFLNPTSQTGFGFNREDTTRIADTVREMGNRDIMTSPQELRRIMDRALPTPMFQAVQDAKTFQTKFKELVGSLKDIAKTLNTSLEGALPVLQEGRRMGFWTPTDVMRGVQLARGAAAATGLSVAQTQQVMQQGAEMARSIGADTRTGAVGMARSLGLVGGALRGGTISARQLHEITGMEGPEAVQAFAANLQASTTRFAASGRARWLLAALSNQSMTGLDAGRMGLLMSGRLGGRGEGGIYGLATGNIRGRGAEFRLHEHELRGDLLQQGPETGWAFIRAFMGRRLYSEAPINRYITRRMIQRFFGGDHREADALARMARDAPNIMRENEQRDSARQDEVLRMREQIMHHSYDGLKRRMGDWWRSNVTDPLMQVGSSMNKSIGDAYEEFANRLWGRPNLGFRMRGFTPAMVTGMREAIMGDPRAMERVFGRSQTGQVTQLGDFRESFGHARMATGVGASLASMGIGTFTGGALTGGTALGLSAGKYLQNVLMAGQDFTNERITNLQKLGVREKMYATSEDLDVDVASGKVLRGAIRPGTPMPFRGMGTEEVRTTEARAAARLDTLGTEGARALGFSTFDDAKSSLETIRKFTQSASFMRVSMDMRSKAGDADDPLQRAKRLVRALRGSKGNAAVKEALGDDETLAAFRLAAAQTEDTRRGFAGVNMSPTGPGSGTSFKTGRELEDQMRTTGRELGEALLGYTDKAGSIPLPVPMMPGAAPSVGVYTSNVARPGAVEAGKAIENLLKEDRFKEAITYMKQGIDNDDKGALATGRKMLTDMAANLPDARKDERAALIKLANPNQRNQKEVFDKISALGGNVTDFFRKTSQETIERRMNLVRESLQGREDSLATSLDKFKDQAGNTGIFGKHFRDYLATKDPGQLRDRLESIVRSAAGADPKDIARMLSSVKDVEGLGPFRGALQSGMVLGGIRESFKKKDAAGITASLNAMVGGLGLAGDTFSFEDIRTTLGGRAESALKVKEKILKDITDPTQRRAVEDILRATRDKKVEGLMGVGARAGTAAAASYLWDPAAAPRVRTKFEDKDISGAVGSDKGMHITMMNVERHVRTMAERGNSPSGAPAEGSAGDGPTYSNPGK